ncbi:hypothetical protein ACF0H5_020345 [Mactra antiquata]
MRDIFRGKLIRQLPIFNTIINSCSHSNGQETIDLCIEQFTGALNDIAMPLFSKTKIINPNRESGHKAVSKNAEWFDHECKIAKTDYHKSILVFNTCKTDLARINMIELKTKYKKLIKSKKRKFEFERLNQIQNLRHSKPKDFWNLFRRKNKTYNNVSVEDFYQYFSSLQNDLQKVTNQEAENFCSYQNFNESSCRFEELDIPITVLEIKKVINGLKRNKAYSIDNLLNEYFIETFDILSSHIVDLFNKILSSGHFPSTWSKGYITPIFKKNDPNDARNYRGVTIVSCLSKIFTGVLNQRLSDWAEKNEILTDAQFGFRKGRSTTDAAFILHSVINKILSEKQRLYCCMIDLKRAFDSVYLNGLWLKLFNLGIDGKFLRIIRDMYSQVKVCVKGCKSFSDFFYCTIGLKQGESLSPLLFALFINDLELYLQQDSKCGLQLNDITLILMLFADDMVLFANSIPDLQNSLDLLHTYCLTWGLEVNTEKTKVIVFRNRGPLKQDEKWYYNGKTLDVVNNFCYLGIVFNYTGTFALHQESLTGKGLKALNVLLQNSKGLNLKPSVMCQLFDAFVGAILNYGGEFCGFGKSKEIERVHLKFCKRLLQVKQSTSNLAVYGELGRFPLFINRHTQIIKYWCKIINSKNILINQFYMHQLNNLNTKHNWANSVKNLLDRNGFSYVWMNPSCVNLNTFHIVFKERLLDIFKQTWYTNISESNYMFYYKHFKLNFKFEKYLDNICLKYRKGLSKLRLTSHTLEVETGRYGRNRVSRQERNCKICRTIDIEDEYHFVIICPFYKNLRENFIKPKFYIRPSVHKFISLLNSDESDDIFNLSKYIHFAFERRKNKLNALQ